MLQALFTAFFSLLLMCAPRVHANCSNGDEVCLTENGVEVPIAVTVPVTRPQPAVNESAMGPEELVDGITADLKARRLMRPPANNALNKVKQLKRIQPDHDYAINGEKYIARVYMVLARRALKLGDVAMAKQRLNSAIGLNKKVPGRQDLIEKIIEAEKTVAQNAEPAGNGGRPEYGQSAETTAVPQQNADGTSFIAPVMVAIPSGRFVMGSESGAEDEKPMHEVSVSAFSMSRFEITFEQYRAYAVDTGLPAPQFAAADQNRPAVSVSWDDAFNYARWLGEKTGKPYRLATEAEWEYAARAGTVTPYYSGEDLNGEANCAGCGSEWDGLKSAPVGSFAANDFGLYDMHGNVWEWVQDCWTENYFGHGDNSAALVKDDCKRHVLRGGSWANPADYARSSYRGNENRMYRSESVGFRVVHDGL